MRPRPPRSAARWVRLITSTLLTLTLCVSMTGCFSAEQAEAKRDELLKQRDTLQQSQDQIAQLQQEAAARQATLAEQVAQAQAAEQAAITQLEQAEANLAASDDAGRDEALARLEAARLQLAQTRAALAAFNVELAKAKAQSAQADTDLAIAKTAVAGADAAVKAISAAIDEFKNPTDPMTQTVHGLLPFLPEQARMPVAWVVTVGGLVLRSRTFRNAATSIAQSVEALKKRVPAVEAALKENFDTVDTYQTGTAKKIVDAVQKKRGLPVI